MNAMDKIKAAVKKIKTGGKAGYQDEKDKFWSCEMDKAGNGMATIRFLPAKNSDDLPWVQYFTHAFKGPNGKWFIDMCRTTLGEKHCPVCESNNKLWDTKEDANIAIARGRKRKQVFVANILVVSDPKNPDNEGKVFMFKFGKKIFEKIMEKIDPPTNEDGSLVDPDDFEMAVFDALQGGNFKLKIRKVEGQANFDKSEFVREPNPLPNIDELLAQAEDLQSLVAPEKFKSYEDQKKRLAFVLGEAAEVPGSDAGDDDEFIRKAQEAMRKQQKSDPADEGLKELERAPAKTPAKGDDGDDDMDFFRSLAEE